MNRKLPQKIALIFILGIIGFFAARHFENYQKRTSSIPQAMIASFSVPNKDVETSSAQKIRHVFILVEENESYADVIANTKDMPYLNMLASSYAYSKNYFADTHPSIGNYFMLTTGKIISNKDSSSGTITQDNIVRRLIAAGKTWKEYSESLPQVGYDGGDTDSYSQHHNPISYFSDVRSDSGQLQNLVPFSQLAVDIASGNLPDYAFIVPNDRDNAHSCPAGTGCTNEQKMQTADKWLKTNIDGLIHSSDFEAPGGGLLVITFDEAAKSNGTHGGGPVAWVAVGPDVKKNYTSDTFYKHENTLRFMLELLGLNTFPGNAANAASMQEFMQGN